MIDEYPKQMRSHGHTPVTVLAEPDGCGKVPIRWSDTGNYGITELAALSPIPSPDEEVEVVVKMTRRERDNASWATYGWGGMAEKIRDACRAHRDAEG